MKTRRKSAMWGEYVG